MSVFFYNIFLWLYVAGVRVAAMWNVKAGKWLAGRRKIFDDVRAVVDSQSPTIWVHCSSLGEFEQGRPIIEKLKNRFPNFKILLTFFSPSGYEVTKNYAGADHIFYLPMDSRTNSQRFLSLVNPALVIFIKYDYWYYYLNEINKREINCLLISAVFRKNQSFFKWFGGFQRNMLRCFGQIFVQNVESKQLLETIDVKHCTVSGDTRFDRVEEVAKKFEAIPVVENFIGESKCIVAGSTWKADEQMLQKAMLQLHDPNLKWIIAPHEVDAFHLGELKKLFPASINFSALSENEKNPSGRSADSSACNILIIDNIGMLSRLYHYSHIAYVGGGFTRDGVHNVLEAAVYGKPVVFGSNYKKYKEAIDLVDCGGASSFANEDELNQILRVLLIDENKYQQKCEASRKYVRENVGATEKILRYIEEKRLLTS